MGNSLCILLRSEYPPKIPEYQEWSKEVDIDSATVRSVLVDHDIVEIPIPVAAKEKVIRNLVLRYFCAIEKKYERCHIVINTHGVPASSDIPHTVVEIVIARLSSLFIPVSQLSALQCDGMSALSPQEQRDAKPMRSIYAITRGKKSSMSALQNRLSRMETMIPQAFKIYGCAQAYNPVGDRELVVAILQGRCADPLLVETITPQRTIDLKTLRDSICVVRATINREGPERNAFYDAAGNYLGAALNQMKEDILTSLQNNTAPKLQNQPLLRQLIEFSQLLGLTLDDRNLGNIFKKWLQANKLYSDARLKVFERYCDILSPLSKEHVVAQMGIFASSGAEVDEPPPAAAGEGRSKTDAGRP